MLLYRVVSSILHLGNVEFTDKDDAVTIETDDNNLNAFCSMFSIPTSQMCRELTRNQITVQNQKIETCTNAVKASYLRDALAKYLYEACFKFIVDLLNKSLSCRRTNDNILGILDIYGFEFNEINGFEQLCINYANDKLQRYFCETVFQKEQEELTAELIEYEDIVSVEINLSAEIIGGRHGIFELLDEECKMPNRTNLTFLDKVITQLSHRRGDIVSRIPLIDEMFLIKHCAGYAKYTCQGFLEKNMDKVSIDQIKILHNNENEHLKSMLDSVFVNHKFNGTGRKLSRAHIGSVSCKFTSLFEMDLNG
ncbi:hypothetical protein GJ496_006213 [Pomphorhynchus laevis]|nr:hypothetical protein GJ496_006213 [Pomphorhynchus laevis]